MQPLEPGRDAVVSQLGRILASPEFVNAGRLSRFLRFAVEKSAAGQSDQVKEYVIGLEVYDRGESYDPRIDAIVRVEAGRLRAKLQRYYETEGRYDPIVISIPRGTYAPAIVERGPLPASPVPPASGSTTGLGVIGALRLGVRRTLRSGWNIALMAVLLSAGSAFLWTQNRHGSETTGLASKPSIAVLPLENLSADKEQEYFSDGITDALVTQLAKVRSLRVISRTSALPYKNTKKPLSEIARELGVDYVVVGTVQRAGNHVRITAHLMAGTAERHVWADSYERDLKDTLALQREVALVIAREISVHITPQEQARFAMAVPMNRDAHEAYLKGRYYQAKRTEDGLQKSIVYFREAISQDPLNGLAYSGLADSYTYMANHGFRAPREVGPQAKAMAAKALQVDDTLAEAHTSLAYILMVYDWDWQGAEKEFRRSIDPDPTYTKAHYLYACYFALQHRFDEALAEIRRAVELDPLSIYDNSNLGWHLQMAHRYREAIEQYRKILDMDPGSSEAHRGLGRALEQEKMARQAITEFPKAINVGGDGPPTIAGLAHAYAVAGETKEAHRLLEQLLAASKRKHVPPYDVALVYTALGNKSEALAWLEKAVQEKDGWLWLGLNLDPRFDRLRLEPRFVAVLNECICPVGNPLWAGSFALLNESG